MVKINLQCERSSQMQPNASIELNVILLVKCAILIPIGKTLNQIWLKYTMKLSES